MSEKVIDRRRFNRLLLSLLGGASASQITRALAAIRPTQPLVMLDPGHGGIDPGAIGAMGSYEKNIALPTVLELALELEATRRFRVKLTRRDDVFVSLQDRVAQACAADADLFLSVHADALPERALRGASVFTLSEKASDRLAAAVAASENRADEIAGIKYDRRDPVVSSILADLARRRTSNLSIELAQDVVDQLGRHIHMLPNSHRSAGFAVLKAPDIPSALVEIGCLSNRVEEQDLRRASYRAVVARAVARSIADYFDAIRAGRR